MFKPCVLGADSIPVVVLRPSFYGLRSRPSKGSLSLVFGAHLSLEDQNLFWSFASALLPEEG